MAKRNSNNGSDWDETKNASQREWRKKIKDSQIQDFKRILKFIK